MAKLIEDVQALLMTAAPTGGVWFGVNSTEPPVYPYIVWTPVVSTDNVSLGGPSDLQNTRIQIDVIALKVSEAVALTGAVDAAFKASSIGNVPISSLTTFEEAILAHRFVRDYSVWATN